MRRSIIYISIFFGLIIALANFKTLGFYFWHDDFSSFYDSQINQCIHGWPYHGFCTIFPFLVKLFGYTPLPYFVIGNILQIISVVAFYIFVIRIIKSSTAAIFLSALFASSYVAAGIYLEAWDPLVSYSVLATFFLSLILYKDSIKSRLNLKFFIAATFVFLVSISLFNFRAASNFLPVIALIFIFAKKISLRQKILLGILTVVLFFFVFYFLPVKILPISLSNNLPDPSYESYVNPRKIKYFFQTISAFVFLDIFSGVLKNIKLETIETIKILVGFILSFTFVVYTFIQKRDKDLTKLRIFSMIWIVTMFGPYWLRNDFSLNTTHRYILWMYPGILLAWASLHKLKFWRQITVVFLLINVVAVNSFYSDFLKTSQKREAFYSQLHALLPTVPEGSVLYFDFPPKMRLIAQDYFRVGLTPPASAIGTEYGVDYKKISLITKSEDLENLLAKPNFQTSAFYSFYYDDQGLIDTTNTSRYAISTLGSNETKISLTYPNNTKNSFVLQNHTPIIPTTLQIRMTSTMEAINLPYQVTCDKCVDLSLNSEALQKIFNFLKSQTDIKTLTISDFGENSNGGYMIDNLQSTHWIGERSGWYKGKKPYIDISVPQGADIEGLIVYSTSLSHIPKNFSIEVDGKSMNVSTQKWSGGQKILFESKVKGGSSLKLTVLQTDKGDVPIINELKFLPLGFNDIEMDKSELVRVSQASYTVTKTDYNLFLLFLAHGINACLKYRSPSYGNGEIPFKLIVDGKPHDYDIRLPSLGTKDPELSLGCTPYPIKTDFGAASIRLTVF